MSPKNGHQRRNNISGSNGKGLRRAEKLLLRRIGLAIHSRLFEIQQPVEWLSFQSGVARSSIREIIAGRSNPRLLTLQALAQSLGFEDVTALLVSIKNKKSD